MVIFTFMVVTTIAWVTGYAMGNKPTIIFNKCSVEQVDRQMDSETNKTVWVTRCINEWQQRDIVIFEQEVFAGDEILYIPFSENDDTLMHGYIHSIDDKGRHDTTQIQRAADRSRWG